MGKKDGRNKKKCEEYRRQGRRLINKDLRAQKHLSKIEHFAKRKEEGKSYKYKPPTNEHEKNLRAKKNVNRKTLFQRWESVFAKLDREIEKNTQARKERKKKYEKDIKWE